MALVGGHHRSPEKRLPRLSGRKRCWHHHENAPAYGVLKNGQARKKQGERNSRAFVSDERSMRQR